MFERTVMLKKKQQKKMMRNGPCLLDLLVTLGGI